MWDFIEKQSGTGASGTITFSGLSGDTDKWYKLIAIAGQSSSTATSAIRFNSSATDMEGTQWFEDFPDWQNGIADDMLGAISSADLAMYEVLIYADSTDTNKRGAIIKGGNINNAANERLEIGGLVWTDTGTELTSLTLVTSAGNWETTTHFYLYKLSDPAG